MKKFKVYRSFGDLDKQIRKHELIAVEYGTSIEKVEEAIIKCIKSDLDTNPDAQAYRNFTTLVYELEFNEDNHKNKTYKYCTIGIIQPDYASENIVIEYGIKEEESISTP